MNPLLDPSDRKEYESILQTVLRVLDIEDTWNLSEQDRTALHDLCQDSLPSDNIKG